MPDTRNRAILDSLRAIVDAGGPQTPVKSHNTPTSFIGRPRGGTDLPFNDDEVLSRAQTFPQLLNETPLGLFGDFTNGLSLAEGPPIGPRAAKGLVKGIKGFSLPGGRVTAMDQDGVARILEGDDAVTALKKMVTPSISRQNRLSAPVPTVSGARELTDVSTPLADSLDTAATPMMKGIGKWGSQIDQLKLSRAKVGHNDIMDIRSAYDAGEHVDDIHKRYPNISKTSVIAIAKRETYPRVK